MAARILIVDDHEMVRLGPTRAGMSEHPPPQRQRDGHGVSLVVPDRGKGISAAKLSEISRKVG
jgi:hypothetical protein